MIKKFLFSLCLLSLLSCDGEEQISNTNPITTSTQDRFMSLSVEEKKHLAPTKLFEAIFQNDYSVFLENLESEEYKFDIKNKDGNTALALAIQLSRSKMMSSLLNTATVHDLMIPNQHGRSFISLASEFNHLELFDEIVMIYSTSFTGISNFISFDFSNLDFSDEHEKNAAHYAKSAAMMDRLMNNWFKSITDINHAFNNFFYKLDLEDNTFLHNASKYQRVQVIKWYTEHFCPNSWIEEEENWIGFGFRKLGDVFGDWEVFKRRYINRKNQQGNTALHLAASLGNHQSLKYLLNCDQIDPTIINNNSRSPLAELLGNIDIHLLEVDSSYKSSFNSLVNRIDPMWLYSFSPTNTFRNILVKQDAIHGNTVLHYAAMIRDSYFYDKLEPYMDEVVYNLNNQTPRDLRK